MSTRSNIAKEIEPGKLRWIYCHFDGYPEHVGRLLQNHYQDEAKIDALLDLGDISSIAPEIGEKHDFDERPRRKEWVNAYGRDRGETGISAKETTSINRRDSGAEFVYTRRNGQWFCQAYDEPAVPLAEILARQDSSEDAA